MENTVFNEAFNIEKFAEGLKKQLTLDYKRLIEYCDRGITESNTWKQMLSDSLDKDKEEEILIYEGRKRALQEMKDFIEKRFD